MSTTITAEAARSRPRVAIVPADHVYVDRVVDLDEVELVRAPSEDLVAWLVEGAEGAGRVDVLHLHVGLATIDDLSSIRTAARAMRLPLVVTLHHHPWLGDHGSANGELCREAAAVVVHDSADAGVLRQRWDVEAYVQPHPHVADLAVIAAAARRDRRPPWRIGIAPSAVPDDSRAARAALARVAQDRDDVVAADGGVAVDDPGHMTAVEWLTTLDALVLGGRTARRAWLELARDIGVAVIAPTAAAVVEPGAVVAYSPHGRVPLEEEIARAVTRACRRMPAAAANVSERLEECDRVRAAHTALYRAVTAATGTATIGTSATDRDHDERQDRRTW